MSSLTLRAAHLDDADSIALLHAESWRRHYRGAYADAFLDGDVVADRRAVWSARLAEPAGGATVLAEDATGPVGFVHVVFDHDDRWGSLVDNLHVSRSRQRSGIGSALLVHAAQAVVERATRKPLHLWVLEQNTAAQAFYRALGGGCVEKAPVPSPGGLPNRLNGHPTGLRFTWPDAAALVSVESTHRRG
jgi:ribosomal protein S18 acetylase RimI-like enzyme